MIKLARDCLSLLDPKSAWQFVVVGILIVGSALLETIGVALVFPLLKLVSDPGVAADLPVIGTFLAFFVPDQSGSRLVQVAAGGFFVIILAKNLLLIFMYYWQNRLVFENEWKTASGLFAGYLNGPYLATAGRNSAELIRNVGEAVNEMFKGVLLGFVNLAAECCIILAIVTVLIFLQPLATIGAVIVASFGVLVFNGIFQEKFQIWGDKAMQAHRELLQSVQEGLHSLKTTKVHGREQYYQGAFSKAKEKLFRLSLITNTVNQMPRLWVEILILATMVLVVLIVIEVQGAGTDLVATLGLFAAAAFRLMPSINRAILAMNNIRKGSAAMNEVLEDSRQFVLSLAETSAVVDTAKINHTEIIRFDGLSFTYPGADLPVIDNVSFDINRGESVGLVGPSGAGKTTAVDILLGLLPASSGRVSINGHEISAVANAWRKRIGYVPQSVYISDHTLRRNVAFGYPDDVIDDDRVWEVLRLAQLQDFAKSLPDGLDTRLAEHGVRLSGGQRQRVGIARALYHDPEVLVLDEATSAMDAATEHSFIRALKMLHGIKTIIIIAHRLSTVRQCDRLIFLDNGRVVDTGTFEELTARNDNFRNLVELARL